MKTLVVDGTYLLYRAFFTKSWGLSDDGEQTGGCFSVLRALHAGVENLNGITEIVYVWDGKRSERRKTIYPEYKANRHDKSKVDFDYEDFNHQQDLLNEVLPMLGVKTLKLDAEGDDVIYWTTRLAGEAVILSDDKDMLLMMLPGFIDVYRPMKEQYCTWENFITATGYTPNDYLYVKAITGDSSDNIKGVKGAGEKTAEEFAKLLKLGPEGAKQNAAKHKSKRMRSIAEQWDVVERNIQLLDCGNEPVHQDDLRQIQTLLSAPAWVKRDEFKAFCRKHAFASMLNDGWMSPFMKVERGRG